MKNLDIEAILTPIAGENPAGAWLRYDPVWDEIQEARRADDLLDRGDWQQEIKTSDWDKVFKLCVSSLTERTKDLQIGVWLLESLTNLEGFAGLQTGLQVLNGFLQQFWDNVYPEIEDDDLDYRVGPLEFLNDKVWLAVKQIPLTDGRVTSAYDWLKWQESRQGVGEDKISAEDFDRSVAASSKGFYLACHEALSACLQEFKVFDDLVDEKFGREAPRLAEFKTALEDCDLLVSKIVKAKKLEEPDEEPEGEALDAIVEHTENGRQEEGSVQESPATTAAPAAQVVRAATVVAANPTGGAAVGYSVNRLLGSAGIEQAVWEDALAKLKADGIKPALEQLLGASCSGQSMREKTNFRLLMAMLCLKGNRPDLARPIVEELNNLVDELQLQRWESPIWIAEVLDTLYRCLTAEGAPDEDAYRAKEIWTKICTLDVTKAMGHMS